MNDEEFVLRHLDELHTWQNVHMNLLRILAAERMVFRCLTCGYYYHHNDRCRFCEENKCEEEKWKDPMI